MKLKALRRLDYNGHYYSAGDEVPGVTEADAKVLIMLGEAEEIASAPPKPSGYGRKDMRARP